MKEKLPVWLKRGIIDTDATRSIRKILRNYSLNTVCDSARCPNKNECYSNNTATFMILGNNCTRNCRFCSVNNGIPEKVNTKEPEFIAEAVKKLVLEYVVITSVTRDDLEDGGAAHFSETITAIKSLDPKIKVEVLTPDFLGNKNSVNKVIEAKPDVFNHNIETVKRLYPDVRPQANYERSLDLIRYAKSRNHEILTKSGIMLGLGEEYEEIIETLEDLENYNCDIVTIGQYIQPTKNHLEVKRYLLPEEFVRLEQVARKIGIKYPVCAPLLGVHTKQKTDTCKL